MSLGVVEVCYHRSFSTLKFQDLGDEAFSSGLVSMKLPDSEHPFHVVKTGTAKPGLGGGGFSPPNNFGEKNFKLKNYSFSAFIDMR